MTWDVLNDGNGEFSLRKNQTTRALFFGPSAPTDAAHVANLLNVIDAALGNPDNDPTLPCPDRSGGQLELDLGG